MKTIRRAIREAWMNLTELERYETKRAFKVMAWIFTLGFAVGLYVGTLL